MSCLPQCGSKMSYFPNFYRSVGHYKEAKLIIMNILLKTLQALLLYSASHKKFYKILYNDGTIEVSKSENIKSFKKLKLWPK